MALDLAEESAWEAGLGHRGAPDSSRASHAAAADDGRTRRGAAVRRGDSRDLRPSAPRASALPPSI